MEERKKGREDSRPEESRRLPTSKVPESTRGTGCDSKPAMPDWV